MSSTGQAVGMVVGGVIGFFAGGNVALGMSIGGAIGGYIDPPKGPKGTPPSASDLAVQTSTYGAPLGRGYGTYARLGNVFWVEGNSLRAEEVEAEGGKGGSKGPSTYKIYGTFAVGFGEGEIDGFGRIWASGKLIADFSSSSIDGAIATSDLSGTISVYTGSPTQLPDDRIQADMGAANTPAYRGLHYLVFKDWPMEDFGNSLMGMQVKAEIIHSGSLVPDDQLLATAIEPSGGNAYIYSMFRLNVDRINATSLTYFSANNDLSTVHSQQYIFGSGSSNLVSNVTIDAWHDGFFDSKTLIYIDQSDVDCVAFELYRNTPTRIIAIGQTGDLLMDSGSVSSATLPLSGYRAIIDRGEMFLVDVGEKLYRMPFGIADPIATVDSSASTFNCEHLGASENYVFLVDDTLSSTTSTTVYKVNRNDLTTAATYTQSVRGVQALICVISDTEFYTLSDVGHIYRWINGVATDTGLYFSGTRYINARLLVVSPTLAYVIDDTGGYSIHACWLKSQGSLVPLADILLSECNKTGLLTAPDIDVTDIADDVRGYKIQNVSAPRSAIEPLQAAWPFDVIPHGYKIKFVRRGKSSVVSISDDSLGCVSGNTDHGVRVTSSREMDSQLPRRLQVTYLDVSREYDANTGPGAERLNTDAVNFEQIDLAVVMTATEAAQAEEVLLYMRWLDRYDVSFVLPPAYINLESADVITVVSQNESRELRLTALNYLPDGRIECQAKLNNAATYSSSAVAQEGLVTGQTLAISGPSKVALLDIPCIDATYMNEPGVLAGMSGYSSGWKGGTLVRSADNGQTWDSIRGFSTPQMTSGIAVTALGTGVTHIVDAGSTLNVRLDQGALYSVSELAMFNGANHFAVGAHGRWEIIAAKMAVLESDGSYTLSGMMRGRFGTEWAMSLHQYNDEVVLLDSAALRMVTMGVSDINMSRLWRGVTYGKTIDSASDIPLTYTGVNLECLSPVYMNGHRTFSTKDWTVSATMRSRLPVEPFSGLATPSGESVESYELEIWDSGSFATLKRTISGLSSPSASYTNAQQVADFGVIQDTLHVRWYRLSATLGRGFPLQGSIYRVLKSSADNYAASVLALSPIGYYKLDDTTTSIADSSTSANTATASAGNVVYQQTALVTGGIPGYSMGFTASGYVTVPRLAAMDGAYTTVFFIKPISLPAASYIYQKGDSGIGGQQGHTVYIDAAGKLGVSWLNGSWRGIITTNAVISAGQTGWFACVYNGTTTFTVYKNGSLVEALTMSAAFVSNTQPLTINGARNSGVTSGGMIGNQDEFAWFNAQLTAGQITALYEEA